MIGRVAAAAGLGALVLAGCGGGSSAPAVRPPVATLTPASPTASATAAGPSGKPGEQKLTITPATGLKDGQTVKVAGTGFSPQESLVVTECVDKGTATTSGDCNLTALIATTSLADGTVSVLYTVAKGPFGANNVVCGAPRPCLISITQASPTPAEEANAPISFG